jgi:hypothetical protein
MDEPAAWSSWKTYGPALFVVAIAIIARLWQINESLWLDELHTAWVVVDGPSDIVARAHIGNQSPLYFYLPWITTSLLGTSELAIRLPSLIAGVGVVLAAYLVAFRFTESLAAACLAAMLAAFDRNMLFYSTEARPYAFVQLVALFQLLAFWRLQHEATIKTRITFVALSALLFHLHYTAILVLSGEIVFHFVRQLGSRSELVPRYSTRSLVIDVPLLLGLMLPAAAQILDIASRREAWGAFVNETSPWLAVHWFSLDTYVGFPLVCLLIYFVSVRLSHRSLTLRVEPSKPRALNSESQAESDLKRDLCDFYLIAFWFLTPLLLVWLTTVTGHAHLYLGRYVMGVAVAPMLFAGLCVAQIESRTLRWAFAVLVFAGAIGTSDLIDHVRRDGRLFVDRNQGWRSAVEWVNERKSNDSLVLVRSGFIEANRLDKDFRPLLREYCLAPGNSMYRVNGDPGWIMPLANRADQLTVRPMAPAMFRNGEVWFIINAPPRTQQRLRAEAAVWGQVTAERRFGDVAVWGVLPK